MTDNKDDQIDFEKEIEALDSFLDEQEDVDFALDDDSNTQPVLAGGKSNQKAKKSGFRKVLGYFIFLLILCGGGYAAYLFAPQFIEKPELESVQKFVSNEGGEVVDDLTNVFKSYVPTKDGNDLEVVDVETPVVDEPVEDINNLPMPSDQVLGEVDYAVSIADALEFVNDDNNATDVPVVEETQSEAITDDLDVAPMDLNTPTSPAVSDLPALSDEEIEIATDIMDMPKDDLAEIVETEEGVTAEEVIDISEDEMVSGAPETEMSDNDAMDIVDQEQDVAADEVIELEEDMIITTEPKVEMVDDVALDIVEQEDIVADDVEIVKVVDVEEEMIPAAPKIETPAVDVEVKKAVPVEVSKSSAVVAPKPSKPADTRVIEAKSLFDSGDYNGALALYQAVLNSDPANTSALTGRQLAQAKLRFNSEPLRPAISVEEKTQETMTQPTLNATPQNLNQLLQQSRSNPRDALLAFKIGDAYKGTNNVKALEWYRRALQLDVLKSSGLDRMAVYDAMADIQ